MPQTSIDALPSDSAADQLLSIVASIHARDTEEAPFVGGLFNGYEKAIHYELITALYRRGLWGVRTEERVSAPPLRQCDVVLPIRVGGELRRLWLEVKSWWLLLGAQAYRSAPKTLWWPATDWQKLQPAIEATPGDQRAVMLVRFWNECPDGRGQTGKTIADRRLSKVDRYMRDELGAPPAVARDLRPFTYESYAPPITTFGDVRLWSTTGSGRT